MIKLKTGDIYRTEKAGDAYKIVEGSLDVFVVPYEKGMQGRPLFLMHASEGSSMPAIAFTDQDYMTWNLHFEATEDCAIQIIEKGGTKPLKKNFARRLELNEKVIKDNLEETLREHYLTGVIRDDVLITTSEAQRERVKSEAEEVLRQAEEGTSDARLSAVDRSDYSASGSGIGKHLGRCAFIAALISVFIVATLLLIERNYGFIPIAASTMMLIIVHWGGGKMIAKWSEGAAEKAMETACEDLYSTLPSGSEDEERARASMTLSKYGTVRRALSSKMDGRVRLITSGIVLIVLVMKYPLAAAITAFALLLSGAILFRYINTSVNRTSQVKRIRTGSTLELLEVLYRIEKIRLSGAVEYMLRRYFTGKREEKVLDRSRETKLVMGMTASALVIAAAIGTIAAYVGSSGGNPGYGGAACMFGCAVALYEGVRGSMTIAGIDGESMAQLSDDPEKKEVGEDGESEEAKSLAALFNEAEDGTPVIELKHVNFGYDGRDVIKNVSITVEKCRSLGIVGASGSGKSTLLGIISGMIEPESGDVLFMGRPMVRGSGNVNEVRSQLRKASGILRQNDRLLTASIRENILMGVDDMDPLPLKKAIEDSGLEEELRELPMGLDTLIREDGENISAGQSQKILIARALVREPSIMFFDEAESELSVEEQEKLREALKDRKVTLILASHHYPTISKCDKIAVLERGETVESGSPENLIEKKGKFYSLMFRQM